MFNYKPNLKNMLDHVNSKNTTIFIHENEMFIHRNCLKYINHFMDPDCGIFYWNSLSNDNIFTVNFSFNHKYSHMINDIKNSNIDKLLHNEHINIIKQNIVLIKNI